MAAFAGFHWMGFRFVRLLTKGYHARRDDDSGVGCAGVLKIGHLAEVKVGWYGFACYAIAMAGRESDPSATMSLAVPNVVELNCIELYGID